MKIFNAILMPVEGPYTIALLPQSDWHDFAKQFVGGYVEAVRTPSNNTLLVNEDGHNLNLPPNPQASKYYKGRSIVGPAILINAPKEEL